MDLARRSSWCCAGESGQLGFWALHKMFGTRYPEIMNAVADLMRPEPSEPVRGLVLGCGDMVAEHVAFVHPSTPRFDEIDAYDVSPASLDRAKSFVSEKGLRVQFHVADVNKLSLPENRYHLIVVFHAYHHFEQVDHITQQINHSLAPGGVFYIWDYVGPCQLQFTARQLHYARTLLALLPPKYRRQLDGQIRSTIECIPPHALSPDEAICSDQILPAMDRHLRVVYQHNWAGILYPLLEGIAFNFSSSREDQDLLRFLFDVDHALCRSGDVEPNFTMTLAMKRA